jgi:hypothetical protein
MHFCLLCFLSFLFFFFFSYSPVHATVVINEIFPKSDREWIELYNTGSESVTLDRWTLQNTRGEKNIFYFNASSVISPKNFLTLSREQTGLTLDDEGDTVRLLDMNHNQIDSQGYFSILGFNVSVGRSVDGEGAWAICALATENAPNNCPVPTPAPTDIPPYTPTAAPTATIFPTDPPMQQTTSAPKILGTTVHPTTPPTGAPTPLHADLKHSNDLRSIGWLIFVLGIVWGIIILLAGLHQKLYHKWNK